MAEKDYLHKLVDELPEVLVAEVVDFVEFVIHKARLEDVGAVKAALAALPEDDEELSEETLRRLEEAERETEFIPLEAIKAEINL